MVWRQGTKETGFTGLERIRTFDAIVMTDANRGWKHEGKKDKREGQDMQIMQNDV